MSKRKDRKRSSSERQDYRKGGRVGYKVGGPQDQQFGELKKTGPANPQMGREIGLSQKGKTTTAGQTRTDRISDTAETIEQSAQGVVPEAARIADVSTEDRTKLDTEIDSQITTMADPTKVTAEPAPDVAPETVTTGTVTTAPTPETITAAKMPVTTVDEDVQERSS